MNWQATGVYGDILTHGNLPLNIVPSDNSYQVQNYLPYVLASNSNVFNYTFSILVFWNLSIYLNVTIKLISSVLAL